MVVDRVERDLVEELGQLTLVLGAQADELLELHAGHEGERALARAKPARGGAGKLGDRALEGGEGNRDPRRPAGELVPELVERLVELVGAERPVEPLALGRHESGLAGPRDLAEVGVQEGGPHPVLPRLRPGPQSLGQPGVVGGRLQAAREGDLRRVRERAEHPGHVLQDALLGPSLRQVPRGLAFEVQDGEAIGGPQELSEVVIAVDANLHDTPGGEGVQRAQLVAQPGAVGDDALRALAQGRLELREPGGECGAGVAELRQHRLPPGCHVPGGDRLGRQGMAGRGGGERPVETPGQRAEARGLVRLRRRQRAGEDGIRRLLPAPLDRGGVVLGKTLERGRPRVALVRHELVQDGQRDRVRAVDLVA